MSTLHPRPHGWILPLLLGIGWAFSAPEPAEGPPRADAPETREATPTDGALPGIPAVRFLGAPTPDRVAVGGTGCAAGSSAAPSPLRGGTEARAIGPVRGSDASFLPSSNPARAPPLLG